MDIGAGLDGQIYSSKVMVRSLTLEHRLLKAVVKQVDINRKRVGLRCYFMVMSAG